MQIMKNKLRLLTGVIIMFSFVTSLFSKTKELNVGDSAPQLSAIDETGSKINLNYNSGYTLVYFYPKADTPGCTAQACSLRDAYTDLQKIGVTVYGVSTDSPEDQKKFKLKYNLPFQLLADTDKKVATAFGVPVNLGFTSRQAFLIKDKKIVWLDRSASTKKQAEDVLQFIKSNP
jgi:peroxiredoxin Q/BCP